jgi:peptidoglycan hydrolase-like protein with peptidoglycan-binding domain
MLTTSNNHLVLIRANTMTTTLKLNKPVLRLGANSPAVQEMQRLLLNYADYIGSRAIRPGAIDGAFGPGTQAAVIAFQKQVFLPGTGVVADLTWRSLFKRGPVDLVDLRQGDVSDIVVLLQVRLTVLNFFADQVDGEFGRFTKMAVINFQRSAGIPQTGVVDAKTWFEISKRPIA